MRIVTPYWTARTLTSDLFNEMENLFEGATQAEPSQVYDERSFGPACEIAESDEHYYMSVDLPGMKKEEIKIEIANKLLTISGERKRENMADKKMKVQRYEKSYGSFKRAFSLPTGVDESKIEAIYENGVLELCLPKTLQAKPRQIEINTGKTGLFDKLLGSKKNNVELKDVNSN